MPQSTYRILQLTDLHLFSKPGQKLLNIDTWMSFEAVFADALAHHEQKPFDLWVLTGDIAQEPIAETYLRLNKKLADLNVPVAWVPGNHDDATCLARHLNQQPITTQKYFQWCTWDIMLLNSAWPNNVAGLLTETTLSTLEQQLQTSKAAHQILFLHHPVLDVSSAWIDPLKLSNADALIELTERFPTIKLVISGHIHQDNYQQRNHTHFYTTPATAVQFKPKSHEFALDKALPGYRTLILHEDGHFTTDVYRVKPATWKPQLESRGYT